ncbi:MAG: hypothetical protein CMG08_00485 [Candidatus Marinimicrobia bacterium]|nr:hypothetical protein [Candidatus Neomarinimicrobiota bacterium]
MPGGESDKGIGALKGQTFFGLQASFSYIDWWHEPVSGETFDHEGQLNTLVIIPSLVYGLSEKWNASFSPTIGIRYMNWGLKKASIHHRSEHSLSNFKNAKSSILGDSQLLLRYLFINSGEGNGYRVYGGAGLTIPSKSVLTSDPFFLNGENHEEHRHFSLSNGTYNYIFESQAYYKQNINPVFVGGFIKIENPIQQSEYGYLSSKTLNITLSAINKRFDQRDSSIGYGASLMISGKGYWNGKVAPNTESIIFSPNITYVDGNKIGALAINIQKSIFLKGSFAGSEGNLKQKIGAWRVGISLRFVPKMKN